MAPTPARTMRRRRLLGGAAALVVLVTAVVVGATFPPTTQATGSNPSTGPTVTPSDTPTSTTPTTTATSSPAPVQPTVLPAGFTVRAGTAPVADATATVITGRTLPDATVAQILGRLPAWSGNTALARDFQWPTATITPPAVTTTIKQHFPTSGDGQNPPTTPPPTPTGPLQVLRMQPEGSVSVAPFVSITFSQPMVVVGTVGQTTAAKIPATITPAVPGHWEWLGTSTLRFSSDSSTVDRLPMATRYTISVPAGTRSTSGGTLATSVTATFDTPPPVVQAFTPGDVDPTALRPVLVAVFNQRVDPARVLSTTVVTAQGQTWPVRLATAAEQAADATATASLSTAPQGRTVAFIPTRDLPGASSVVVTVKAGTHSAEGPLTSPNDATFAFTTHAAMTLRGGSCDQSGCQPGGQIVLTFSNAVATGDFDPATVTVDPALSGGTSIQAYGNHIVVLGATRPGTTYRVTVKAGLRDLFGQALAVNASASVTFGHGSPQIYSFPTSVTTLDPLASSRTVTVSTVEQKRFRERVFAVSLTDWTAYRTWYLNLQQLGSYQPGTNLHLPDWSLRLDRTVIVAGAGDALSGTALDLSAEITSQQRQAVVLIEPIDPVSGNDQWQNRPTASWVQWTNLGLDAIGDQTSLRTWVTDLRTGSAVSGVSVTVLDGKGAQVGSPAISDAHGLGTIDLTSAAGSVLMARHGDQTALLPGDLWGGSWQRQPQSDHLGWFVADDRQTYRPGETVSVKGWVRRQSGNSTMALSVPATGTVSWSAMDGSGNRIGAGKATIDQSGGFDLTLALPAGAHLGNADLHLDLPAVGVDNTGTDHFFTLADFRTPAFGVISQAATTDPAIRGSGLNVRADATYYAGGAVSGAPVAWQVQTSTTTYTPPGWGAYTFGVWTPWWYDSPHSESAPCCDNNSEKPVVKTFAGTTDANGSQAIAVNVGDLGQDSAGLPVDVIAQATVTDVDRQQIAGTATVLVHPASDYVGLASDATFVGSGQPLVLQVIAADIDGAAATGRPISVTAARVVGGGYGPAQSRQQTTDPQTCSITSAATPVTCTFNPKLGGEYQITATVTDAQGRTSRTQLTRWVAGPDGAAATGVAEQTLTVIPDRQEYQPGQSAQLLVASPIATGTGLITLSHNGIVSTTTFSVVNHSAVVPIPITEALVPGVSVSVEVVGTGPRADGSTNPAQPAYATGTLDLTVSTRTRALTVSVTSDQTRVKPGGSTTVHVTVTDSAGKPVAGSQFAVAVVDEAVLDLSGAPLPDLLAAFYPKEQQDWMYPSYARELVQLDVDPAVGGRTTASGSSAMSSSSAGSASAVPAGTPVPAPTVATDSAASGSAAPLTPITLRKDLRPLALFRPAVTTGADGTAQISVALPDNLTRYRVTVLAVSGADRFGSSDATLTAGLALTVRPMAPRFLNFGDRAELPVLVQNLSDSPRTTDVVLQAANLTVSGSTSGATGQEVTVPANGRVEVRFAVAADRAGTARFRVAAVSGQDADAAQQDLPVYTPSTSETFASYGSVTGNSTLTQPVTAPTGVIPEFGGLQVTTSSTALSQLTDALSDVATTENSSSDALAAQVIALASMGDVLQAFSISGSPTPAQLRALVTGDLTTLAAQQNDDGGFPYWQRGDDSGPFNTVQVVQAMVLAKARGFAGDATATTKALPYLRAIDSKLPATTTAQTRDIVDAYALAVRALAGESVTATADGMVTARGAALPLDAVAWLLPLVSTANRSTLLTRIGNAAVDDAGTATFTQQVTDDAWTTLQSDTRTDALVLDSLLSAAPTSDLIPKVVAGLIQAQRGGRWDNLQENTFGLVAVRHYYDVAEATTPHFDASVWLGQRFAGQHAYSGRTSERTIVDVPTTELIKAGNTSVTLADQGAGRMYYRIGLTTSPSSLSLAAVDRGFTVARTYQGADDPADVTRDANGVWHVKAGARIEVTVTMVARSAQSHVSLTDPLPAGLEPLDPALATTTKDLAGKNAVGASSDPLPWTPTWFDHQELRDDRAQADASWLPGGVYTYSYLAAATTPGTFVVPPATAAQTYAPETFGRTATDRVVVG